ncbi:ABC transporter substrate-binding protein [Streptomyces sp. NPDC101132]|uniref:protein kinase domain-containing protein n=1 Tax=Streptomyces sp. NPDC101132 TaxID=3366110 RepID=UPI0037F25FF8
MEPLLPTDPSRIGGYRLLGRLGAGGMGVVYLGRAEGGGFVAVKAIRAEYAEEADFRARFRREVRAARRVRSPYVVALADAEPEAESPWLATEFVPGLSLAEAVGGHGPLPVRTVRVLGLALARALAAVHQAGLVHRDVKPANVLLAPDGPRLIDFGIARAADTTALTSTDMMVGTPGFLSPEQAQGRRATAASDVFALGCLLVYAATGRAPFGAGPVDALLYRTVHDEPDVSWAELGDAELAGLLRVCLAKDPYDRPTPDALGAALAEGGGGYGGGVAGYAGGGWLPEPVVAAVAARAAEFLALPDIEATVAEGRAGWPGRRRFLLAGAGAALAAGGGTAAWLGLRPGRGAAGRGPRRWAIGVHADLSGPGAAVGRAQERGVRLAVEAFNSRRERPFTLSVVTADDRGEGARAPGAAVALAGDRDVLAVIGPTGDASVYASLDRYGEASLPLVTVSAAGSGYGLADRRALLQACPVAAAHAEAVNLQFVAGGTVRRLGVLCDRSGDSPAWETAFLADLSVGDYVPEATAHPRVVPRGETDYAPVVEDLLARRLDGFLYTGAPPGAARVARLLRAAGFAGPRIADYPSMGPEFLRLAGPDAEGWQFFAPYTGPEAPEAAPVTAAHRRRYGSAPAHWTAEAYDVTLMVADRLARLAAGGDRPGRAELLAGLAKGTYRGLLREYAFDGAGRIRGTASFLHRVESGRVRYVGPAPARPRGRPTPGGAKRAGPGGAVRSEPGRTPPQPGGARPETGGARPQGGGVRPETAGARPGTGGGERSAPGGAERTAQGRAGRPAAGRTGRPAVGGAVRSALRGPGRD